MLALLLTACSTPRVDDTPPPEEAFRFGGISLPAGGKVLKTDYQRGIDVMYRVDVSIPAKDVQQLLKASNFAPGVTEDSQLVDGHRVFRKVIVDPGDPATVHLSLFTT
ncbi:hypothetical protein [Amycolatopsis sp. lyj-112]|uniref:hypothetical protein n=1 Tax=Amycolatopsis sp. lyj-112 TaxID=2789288 RepID=UPI00397A10D2